MQPKLTIKNWNRLKMNELKTIALKSGFLWDANELFRLVDSVGLPLEILLEQVDKACATHGWSKTFPWYGYARRRWHAGTSESRIRGEIREALEFVPNWPDSTLDVEGELLNLWPEQSESDT
jgi:hypothetical protein